MSLTIDFIIARFVFSSPEENIFANRLLTSSSSGISFSISFSTFSQSFFTFAEVGYNGLASEKMEFVALIRQTQEKRSDIPTGFSAASTVGHCTASCLRSRTSIFRKRNSRLSVNSLHHHLFYEKIRLTFVESTLYEQTSGRTGLYKLIAAWKSDPSARVALTISCFRCYHQSKVNPNVTKQKLKLPYFLC